MGHAALKAGDLQSAAEHYSRCIALQANNVVGYTNRALVYLKLGEAVVSPSSEPEKRRRRRAFYHEGAAADCDAALAIDAANVKAFFRRAKAKKALGKFKEAIEDIKALLKVNDECCYCCFLLLLLFFFLLLCFVLYVVVVVDVIVVIVVVTAMP